MWRRKGERRNPNQSALARVGGGGMCGEREENVGWSWVRRKVGNLSIAERRELEEDAEVVVVVVVVGVVVVVVKAEEEEDEGGEEEMTSGAASGTARMRSKTGSN